MNLILAAALAASAFGAVIQEDIDVQGTYTAMTMAPDEGGAINSFSLVNKVGNFAGGDGLLQEGFGVGSYYVPNRRLNEKVEVLEEFTDRPVFRYSYDCDGPNIKGLHVTRQVEPLPNEASIRVTWTVENTGDEAQWIAPWVLNEVAPGGTVTQDDRWDMPTTKGIVHPDRSQYHAASRNWIAATDPIELQTWYAVFNADQTHSWLALQDEDGKWGYQTAFVPVMLAPKKTWKTVYRMNAVGGLKHVDFATEEFAAQIDCEGGKLTVLFSAAKPLNDITILARVVGKDGNVVRFPDKKFSITPEKLVRCTYTWAPPADGAYDFMAQLSVKGKPYKLGAETGSPHGGIDTQFVVGKQSAGKMEAWTDAPYALQRGARTLTRTLAAPGDVAIWFESGLEKIFHEDVPKAEGTVNPSYSVALARNESESFQVVLRPPKDKNLEQVRVVIHELTGPDGAVIPANQIAAYNECYQNVYIPSYFEGPTGDFPDALTPFESCSAPGGVSTPIWFTVRAPENAAAGQYRGMIEVYASGIEPVELWLEARVFDFRLPKSPACKTDFGFWLDAATAGAQARGGSPDTGKLAAAYRENAFEHRVTLRELTMFPRETANYEDALKRYGNELDRYLAEGATTFAVPDSLLDAPGVLEAANAFVKKRNLSDRVFVQIADEAPEPAWQRVLERMQQWKDRAPDIPIMATTVGLKPFLPDALDRWTVHSQIFDTVNSSTVLQRIAAGKEVWCYVNHAPARPYANFFLDFAAIEHRILFWQAWALGVKGMHYWGVNYAEPNQDPWKSTLDITPVNGDGLLVYPGADGPVNSIRWECVRDGLEDYDYLAVFQVCRRKLAEKGGQEALIARADKAGDLGKVVPDLVSFSRDPKALLDKRIEIGALIEDMGKVIGKQ